jgi:hypothetical protein
MHPFLTKLGVCAAVQLFFQDSYKTDRKGNLLFSYGDQTEYFGPGLHRVPRSEKLWICGNDNFALIREVFVCSSAMEGIAFLALNQHLYPRMDNLLFLATGTLPCAAQFRWIRNNLKRKEFSLVFARDLLGRVCDIKIAAGIRDRPVCLSVLPGSLLGIRYLGRCYSFREDQLTLNTFKRASGFSPDIRTPKPRRTCDSYLDLLSSGFDR